MLKAAAPAPLTFATTCSAAQVENIVSIGDRLVVAHRVTTSLVDGGSDTVQMHGKANTHTHTHPSKMNRETASNLGSSGFRVPKESPAK